MGGICKQHVMISCTVIVLLVASIILKSSEAASVGNAVNGIGGLKTAADAEIEAADADSLAPVDNGLKEDGDKDKDASGKKDGAANGNNGTKYSFADIRRRWDRIKNILDRTLFRAYLPVKKKEDGDKESKDVPDAANGAEESNNDAPESNNDTEVSKDGPESTNDKQKESPQLDTDNDAEDPAKADEEDSDKDTDDNKDEASVKEGTTSVVETKSVVAVKSRQHPGIRSPCTPIWSYDDDSIASHVHAATTYKHRVNQYFGNYGAPPRPRSYHSYYGRRPSRRRGGSKGRRAGKSYRRREGGRHDGKKASSDAGRRRRSHRNRRRPYYHFGRVPEGNKGPSGQVVRAKRASSTLPCWIDARGHVITKVGQAYVDHY